MPKQETDPNQEVLTEEKAIADVKQGFGITRWWRALDKDGKLLAETSNPNDFLHLGIDLMPDVTFQRLHVKIESDWVTTPRS